MEFVPFSNLGQLKKVMAGLKGGPFFQNLMKHPEMTFEDPREMTGMQAYTEKSPMPIPVIDAWNDRRKGK